MGDEEESPRTVQYYSSHTRALGHRQQNKVEKFLEHDCVRYNPDTKQFSIAPIPGYNVTEHFLERDSELGWTCDCQGFAVRLKRHLENPLTEPSPICSHICTLLESFARRHKERRENFAQLALSNFPGRG